MRQVKTTKEVEVNEYIMTEEERNDLIKESIERGVKRGYDEGYKKGKLHGRIDYRNEIAEFIRTYPYEMNIAGACRLVGDLVSKLGREVR